MADLLSAQQALDEQNRINTLRQTGIKQAQNVADVTQQGATDLATQGGAALQKASDYGRLDIANQAAEALAAARGQGAASGGISYGGLLQAGKTAGISSAGVESNIAQQQLGLTKDVNTAKQEAAAQSLEATKFAQQAGSQVQDQQKKMSDYDAKMQEILASTKGFFKDDTTLAGQKIAEMVAGETDPTVKQHYLDLASKYANGSNPLSTSYSGPGFDY